MGPGADTWTMTTHAPTPTRSTETVRLVRLLAVVATVALAAFAFWMVKSSMDEAEAQGRCIAQQSAYQFGPRDPACR